jgi:uncharacterized membrane protein
MSTIQQVGFASSGYSHAGLWNGSAASWVDLHPTGAVTSEAFDTDGSIQVGFVNFTSLESGKRASLWNGSAASWISLHDLLPTDFDYSVATGIASDGSHIYISGWGHNTTTGRAEALLWVASVPEPTTFTLVGIGMAMTFVGVRRQRRARVSARASRI